MALPSGALAAMRSDAFNSALDGLSAHVCVLDEHGTIVAVNQAWRAFALANGGDGVSGLEGSNYLHVCQAAADSEPPRPGPMRRLLQASCARCWRAGGTVFSWNTPAIPPPSGAGFWYG